jgi:single-strand DNA-binding protein
MNQIQVSVTGNVATPPRHAITPTGVAVTDFRLACTPRRKDKDGVWGDGPTSWVTVSCFRRLAEHAASSLAVGDPVLVLGRLEVKENEREGRTYKDASVIATTLGHDLTRGTTAFTRRRVPEADADAAAA